MASHDRTPRSGAKPKLSAVKERWRTLERAVAPFVRPCWKPLLRSRSADSAVSKFGGAARLGPGERWPVCASCEVPLSLLLQLGAEDLPADAGRPFGNGLLQLFYCTDDHCSLPYDGHYGFDTNHLARVILPRTKTTVRKRPRRTLACTGAITGWERLADYPSAYEAEEVGVPLSLDEASDFCFYAPDVAGFECPRECDKLLGWPHWIQGVVYPDCPTCNKKMRYLFQIASEDNVPYMFGDAGIGHVFICPTHPRRVAFAWSCC